MNYEIVKRKPVAKFYYQGSHTHPIRRTVLIIEENRNTIVGYELREGRITRDPKDAPVKAYSREKISKYGDYSRLRMNAENQHKSENSSTLSRFDLQNLIFDGV